MESSVSTLVSDKSTNVWHLSKLATILLLFLPSFCLHSSVSLPSHILTLPSPPLFTSLPSFLLSFPIGPIVEIDGTTTSRSRNSRTRVKKPSSYRLEIVCAVLPTFYCKYTQLTYPWEIKVFVSILESISQMSCESTRYLVLCWLYFVCILLEERFVNFACHSCLPTFKSNAR